MCGKQALDEILEKVYRGAKEALGDKLEKVILFGSYARGDFDDESDIDIFLLADIPNKDADMAWRKVRNCTGDLSLEYDVVVSMHVTSSKLFHRFRNAMPYFMNVIKEGKEVSYA